MNISIDIDYLSEEERVALIEELVESTHQTELIEALGDFGVSDIVNSLTVFQLDKVIEHFDDYVIQTIKNNYVNEIDCADFINDTDPKEIQNFVDNLTDATRVELFKMLNIKVNPNA